MDDGNRFVSGHLKNIASGSHEMSENTSKAKESSDTSPKSRNTKRAVSSLTESALLVDILKNEGYDVIEAAGAGYKILAVIQGKFIEYDINSYADYSKKSFIFIKLLIIFFLQVGWTFI